MYLMKISQKFQELVRYALEANYISSHFEKHHNLKLATIIATRNDIFMNNVHESGTVCAFQGDLRQGPSGLDLSKDDKQLSVQDSLCVRWYDVNMDDLEDIVFESKRIRKVPHGDILTHLGRFYDMARGLTLGSFDNSLLAMSMKWQSAKWEPLALGYISDIVAAAHHFILTLLQVLCPDSRVRSALMSKLLPDLFSIYDAAFKSVHFILEVELGCAPSTLNHYFNDNLEKRFVTTV